MNKKLDIIFQITSVVMMFVSVVCICSVDGNYPLECCSIAFISFILMLVSGYLSPTIRSQISDLS